MTSLVLFFRKSGMTMTAPGMSNQSSCNTKSYPSKLNSALQNSSLGICFSEKSYAMLLIHLGCFYLQAMLNLLNNNHALSSPIE
jgi:hypothetical protein